MASHRQLVFEPLLKTTLSVCGRKYVAGMDTCSNINSVSVKLAVENNLEIASLESCRVESASGHSIDYLFVVYLPVQSSSGGLIRQLAFVAHQMPDADADIWIGESLRKELSLPSQMTTIDDGNKTISFGNNVLPIIAAINSSGSTNQCLSREGEYRLLINLLSFSGFPSKIFIWIPEPLKDQIKKLALGYLRRGCRQLLAALTDVLDNLEQPQLKTAQNIPDLDFLLKELAILRQEVMCLRKPTHVPMLAMIEAVPNSEVQSVNIQNQVEQKLEELKRDYKKQMQSYVKNIVSELNGKNLANFSVLGNCSCDELCKSYLSQSSTSDSSYVESNPQQASFSQYQLAMTLGTIEELQSVYSINPKNLLWQELGTRITASEETYLRKLGFGIHKAEKMNSFAGFDGDFDGGITVLVAVHAPHVLIDNCMRWIVANEIKLNGLLLIGNNLTESMNGMDLPDLTEFPYLSTYLDNCKCVALQDVAPANFNHQALYHCTSESLAAEHLFKKMSSAFELIRTNNDDLKTEVEELKRMVFKQAKKIDELTTKIEDLGGTANQ